MKKVLRYVLALAAAVITIMGICQISYGAEMTYSNGKLEVSGLDSSAKAICASYDNNKVLTGIKITDISNGTNELNAKTGDKIFLWQSLIGIKPLSEAVTVKDTDKSVNNILIVYFSRAGENWQVGTVEKGNTAVIAEYIENKINADVFEIKAKNPYPVSYQETLDRVREEGQTNARPEFVGEPENLGQYDTVFLGYPIWNGGLPNIMYSFLEKYDLSGKTVIPFSTHGGSGWGRTLSELKTLCPNATFVDGFSTAGTNARNAQSDVEKWIDGLELNIKNTDEENEKLAVLAALNARCQAMVKKDLNTLDEIVDDDIVIRHMTGTTQTKQEWIDDIASGALRYDSIEILDPTVEINGDTATISYTSLIAANAYGSYSDSWRMSGTATYIKKNGKWIWSTTTRPQGR